MLSLWTVACVGQPNPPSSLETEMGTTGSVTVTSTATTMGPAGGTSTDPSAGVDVSGVTGSDSCADDADCEEPTPACSPSGRCVECRPEGQWCPPGEYCEPTMDACLRGCQDDADCPSRCDPVVHECVDCVSSDDCADPTPACDPLTQTCVECARDSDCFDPTPVCDVVGGRCIECQDDADCAAPTPVCDIGPQICVECISDTDCPAMAPFCLGTQTCVECISDSDCPGGGCNGNFCGSLGSPCMEDSDCSVAAGEECCTASNCLDTCMIPCVASFDCPPMMPPMGCEHGYCLFPCNNDDADCAMWPGYTCVHGGTLCEL